jgi:trans-aconitate methyltransferase
VSWDETFSRRYDEWSSHMTEDIAFYTELAREADGPLVELAVGNGRVAIPVARATGRAVIGIDSSPAMLEQARKRAADAGFVLDLHEADMRAFSLAGQAALIYCPFRRRHQLALVGNEERMARAPRCRWSRAGGSLRYLRSTAAWG